MPNSKGEKIEYIIKALFLSFLFLFSSPNVNCIPAIIGGLFFIKNKPKIETKFKKFLRIAIPIISLIFVSLNADNILLVFFAFIVPAGFIKAVPLKNKNDIIKFASVFLLFLSTELMNKSLSYIILPFKAFDGNFAILFGVFSNIYVIVCVIYILNKLFNNTKIGYYITFTFMLLLSTVNYFVYALTSQAFQLSDIFKAKTALSVAGQQSVNFKQVIYYIICLIPFALVFYLISKIKKEKKRRSFVNFYEIIGVCLICAVITVFNSSVFLNFNGNLRYGLLTNFIMTADNGFKKPKDMIDVEKNLSEYNVKKEKDNGKRPNIIVIMNEAFADINSGSQSEIYDYDKLMPTYTQITKNYPSGVAYSSVKGNNTVTSEMEFLTSTSSLFSTEGAEIWRKHLTDNSWSIVKDMKEKGYETYGIHPSSYFNYNRYGAWEKLGFDNSMFIENMDNENIEKYRDLVSDKANYELIIEQYEKNKEKNKPFFCYNITIQNHAGYSDAPEVDDTVKTPLEIEDDYTNGINNYLTLMKLSDDALKTLIDYFSNVDEETYILFYGDHQPMFITNLCERLSKSTSDISTIKSTHEVPYFIWSNKKCKVKTPEYTSINYLSNILYGVSGLSKPERLIWNNELMKEYPVITSNFALDKNGNYYSTKDALSLKDVDEKIKLENCYTYELIKGK